MMNHLVIAISIALLGCSVPAPTEPMAEVHLPASPMTTNVVPLPDLRDPKNGAAIDKLSPRQVFAAAHQAKADATGYVVWSGSKAENIERLTELTTALQTSIAKMKAHALNGQYLSADVRAAKHRLRDLRTFLATKDD